MQKFPNNSPNNSSKNDMAKLLSPFVRDISPYIPGKSLRETETLSGIPQQELAKLGSNENCLGPSQRAFEAIEKQAKLVHFYPESQDFDLRERLAKKTGVKSGNIVLGNGSNELIEIIARTFLSPEVESIYGDPAFIVYSMLSQAVGAKKRPVPLKNFTHDLDAMSKAITPLTRVIFIANPNNPTGTLIPKKEVENFLEKIPPHLIVVLDEAYYEYSPQDAFVKPERWIGKNVIFLRTFSKFFALAGMRIGYAICSKEIAQWLNTIREPFNVNRLAIAAASAVLNDEGHAKLTTQTTITEKARIEEGYKALGLDFVPTDANFHMVDVKKSGNDTAMALLKKGVIVRPLENYNLKTHLRIAIGREVESVLLLKSLKEVLVLI